MVRSGRKETMMTDLLGGVALEALQHYHELLSMRVNDRRA